MGRPPRAIVATDELATWARRLGPHGAALVAALRAYVDRRTGRAWPSLATLSALVGVSPRQVQRIVAEAVAVGLLHLELRSGRSTVYVLGSTHDTGDVGDELPTRDTDDVGSVDRTHDTDAANPRHRRRGPTTPVSSEQGKEQVETLNNTPPYPPSARKLASGRWPPYPPPRGRRRGPRGSSYPASPGAVAANVGELFDPEATS